MADDVKIASVETNWAPSVISTLPGTVPEWANELLLSIGGTNPFGKPNFRLIWSNSRMELVGGEFDDYIEGTDIWLGTKVIDPTPMPKYWNHPDRYIVECWRPAEVYAISEEQWDRQTEEFHAGRWIKTLGEYPREGDYEPAWILEDPKGNPMPPSEMVIMELVQRIKASYERYSAAQRKEALVEREVAKAKEEESKIDAIVRDAASGFPGNSEIVLAEPKHFEKEQV